MSNSATLDYKRINTFRKNADETMWSPKLTLKLYTLPTGKYKRNLFDMKENTHLIYIIK